MKNPIDFLPFLLICLCWQMALSQNNACQFNGTTDYIQVPTDTCLRPTTALTVEARLYVTSFTPNGYFFSSAKFDGAPTQSGFYFGVSNGGVAVYLKTNDNSSFKTLGGGSISANTCNHVAFTYNGDTLKVYVNGALTGSTPCTGTVDWDPLPNGLFLGKYNDDNEDYYFTGLLEEVRYWNVARTAAEINANKDVPLSSGTGLLAVWHLDETGMGAGITAVNSSVAAASCGSTADGTTFGTANTPVFTASCGTTCTWVGGTGNWSDPAKWSTGTVPMSNNPVVIASGTVTLDVAATIHSLAMSGGSTLALGDNLTVSGNLSMIGTTTTINGTGNLDVGGDFTWTKGIIAGTGSFTLSGDLISNGGDCILNTRNMLLTSGGTLTNTTFGQLNGAIFTLASTATLFLQATTFLGNQATNTGFVNHGIIETTGTGTVTISTNIITNDGTINVNGGNLSISGGNTSSSTHTGATINIASGKTLSFSAPSNHDFTNTNISGGGIFEVYQTSFAVVNINAGSTLATAVNIWVGKLTINTPQNISSLTMSGGGVVTLNANLTVLGDLDMSGTNTTITGAGNLAIGGNFTWTRGTISGTGTLSLTGTLTSNSGNCTLSRSSLSLTSGGTLTATLFTQTNGASLIIPAGQTLTVSGNCTFSGNLNNTSIVNHGTIVTAGTGVINFNWNAITNDGTIQVNGSNITFGAGANTVYVHDGAMINIAAGKTLEFNGISHTFSNNATVSGAGTFKSTATSVSVNSGSTITTILDVAGGTLTLNVPQTIPSLSVGSTFNLSADLTVSGNVALTAGSINGTGNLTINGNLTWTGGADILGTGLMSLSGTLTVSVSGTLGRSLTLASGATFTSFALYIEDNAVLKVPSGQTLVLNSGSFNGDGTGTLENEGNITITGSSALFQVLNLAFINKGNLTSIGPNLFFGGGSSSIHDGATVTIGPGDDLKFDGTTHTFINSSSVSGAGTITISGNAGFTNITLNSGSTFSNAVIIFVDALNINTPQTFDSLAMSGGTITLNAALSIANGMTWSGGTISSTNPTTIPVGGTLTMSGSPILSNTNLTLNGGGTWTNASCTLQNNASITIPTAKTLTINNTTNRTLTNGSGGGGTLTNNGTLVKTGSAIFSINSPYTAASGSFTDIQQGTLDFNNTFDNSGTVKGNGSIDLSGATVSSSGTFSPGASPGTLTIVGNYTNSVLDIEIEESGGNVAFDQLIVTGTATLGGTLNVTETGNVVTGTWVILTAANITGTFSTVNLPACYSIEYSGDSVILYKAVAKIWDGSVGTWNTPSSWDPPGVPCILDDVVINNGQVRLDIQPQMASLTINGGSLEDSTGYQVNAPCTIGPSGFLNILNGAMDINDDFDNNGTVQGYGIIDLEDANVIGYGTFAPGNSAGTLTVKGTYCNETAIMEVGGTLGNGVSIDLLEVTQAIMLGGDLNILYLGGTVPPGTRTIMECPTGGCLSGTFDNVSFPPECQGACNLNITTQQVQLVNTLAIEFTGTCTWLGGTGDWSNQSNWSCNDVPNANDTAVINSGQVILNGAAFVSSLKVTSGTVAGTGTLTVNDSLIKTSPGVFTMDAPLQLPNGFLHAAAGTLDFNNLFTYGGTVGGNGNIDLTDATVQALSGGTFSPGASPGTLSVLGNYTNNVLHMEIGENSGVVSKDLLSVSGNVNLSGSTLNVFLLGGTMPTGSFELLTFGGNPGNTVFSNVNFPSFCGDCALVYTNNSISLENGQACIPNLTIENMIVPTGTYKSENDLVSNMATVASGSMVIFQSDTGILLGQDFSVEAGGDFETAIQACPQNFGEGLPEEPSSIKTGNDSAVSKKPKE
ncbi:MAG: hypothetical protein H6577_06590 [Lewinellaceae bacterium]|nr:hypothetical protein [Lewinellaceae bacterium]